MLCAPLWKGVKTCCHQLYIFCFDLCVAPLTKPNKHTVSLFWGNISFFPLFFPPFVLFDTPTHHPPTPHFFKSCFYYVHLTVNAVFLFLPCWPFSLPFWWWLPVSIRRRRGTQGMEMRTRAARWARRPTTSSARRQCPLCETWPRRSACPSPRQPFPSCSWSSNSSGRSRVEGWLARYWIWMLCHTCTGSAEGGVTPAVGLSRVEGWLARYWIWMLCHTCTGSAEGGVTPAVGQPFPSCSWSSNSSGRSRVEGWLARYWIWMLCHTCTGSAEGGVTPAVGLSRVEGWLARYWIWTLCHTCTGSVEGGVTPAVGLLRVEGWLARYWIWTLCHTCTGSVEGVSHL